MTEMLPSIDPATGEVIAEVPVTSLEQLQAMLAQAREAQPAWADLGVAERAKLLRPAADRILEHHASLAQLITREMGKALPDAVGEVTIAGRGLERDLAEIEAALAPRTLEQKGLTSTIYYEPHGVCGAISPWNFPVLMPHSLVFPALMAGNTVVLKPSEETPLSAQAYVDFLRADLPPGVLHIAHGADAQGRALVAGDVDLVAFTGSREAGKHILQAAGGDLKRVILELGGKDPLLVLDDADVEAAAGFAARNSFRNTGQVCISTERIYVHEAIAERFEAELTRLAGEIVVGYGLDEGTTIGPMVNARQKAHVAKQVEAARKDGATVLLGGDGGEGNYYGPTVLTGVTHAMEIMREETFGPVACVQRYRDVDEGIRLANDTPFGLGAVVFGQDLERAQAVARRIEAGMVGINRGCGGVQGSPWVGAKQSGYGYHSGPDGHRQFTVPRVVTLASG
jgi:acyl-CoA reductase-like NAD-dependent aldehyde dehydrogenase